MNDDIEQLRRQVQELSGRMIADSVMMRLAVLHASTPDLRATEALVEKMADDPGVKLQFRASPQASHAAFEAQRKQWLQLLKQEIASRDSAALANER